MQNHPHRIYTSFFAVFDTAEARRILAQREQEDKVFQEQVARDGSDDVNELAIDEQRAYRVKTTKWIKASLISLADVIFWFVLRVSNIARGPVQHFFNILSKQGPEGLSQSFGRTRGIPIVALVCMRAVEVKNEFLALLESLDTWVEKTMSLAVSDLRPHLPEYSELLKAEEKSFLRLLALELVHHNYTAYVRRLVQLLDQCLV